MKPFAVILSLLWISLAQVWAETLVTEAKILEVTARGFILSVGTEPLAVEDSVATRCWKACAPAKRDAFAKDDKVHVRIKTDTDPPALREIADEPSWRWLDRVRHEFVKGSVEKVDAKQLVLKLDDGTTFAYRATDKSQVKLKGAKTSVFGLEAGTALWAKGRLLANLDTWLAEATDVQPPASTKPGKTSKPPKQDPLPPTGTLEGHVLSHLETLKMFDMQAGARALHISYNASTRFTLGGRPAKARDLSGGQSCVVEYRRDRTGRIIASKVELRPPGV